MRYLTYLLPFFLFLTSCGGGNQQKQQAQNEGIKEQKAQTQTQDIRTIEIIGIDQMKYVVKEKGSKIGTANTVKTSSGESYLLLENIKVDPGERLHIQLTTKSKLPSTAMSHNWILLKLGIDPAAFTSEATQAKANDYIPKNRTGDIIAHTGLAAGGGTVDVTFTVPEETGQYDYLCSFPGHFAAGMKGKLIVQ